jgi:hypothetical protein
MVQQSPIRMEFYDKYKKIIDEYNAGKDIQAVQKAFDDINKFMAEEISPEMERALREGLDEESLAIYDLLRKPELTPKEEAEVKKVARKTLQTLKAEKLRVKRWRESIEVSAQVKVSIRLPDDIKPGEHEFIIIVDQILTTSADKECNLMDFSGTVDWSADGLEYQRQSRGEWE